MVVVCMVWGVRGFVIRDKGGRKPWGGKKKNQKQETDRREEKRKKNI